MADLIIFDKSSGDVMKDYFGVPLKTMVKVLYTNKDHKEERKLPRDLPQSRSNPKYIPEFDVHSIMRDFQRKNLLNGWQSWEFTFILTRFLIIKMHDLLHSNFLMVLENGGLNF